jgi:hypothetical protein
MIIGPPLKFHGERGILGNDPRPVNDRRAGR